MEDDAKGVVERMNDNPYALPDLYCADCMEAMRHFPDKFFDLAVVDPPYGIDILGMNFTKSGAIKTQGRAKAKRRDYRRQDKWDVKPSKEYFDELLRVSQRQIIWGGNYFSDMLPASKSFICWDKRTKDNMVNDFADCEYAWCSGNLGVARMFRFMWNGMLQGDMAHKEERFHPTQKPVRLYQWIFKNYAREGMKILDTHAGSASSLVAAYKAGLDAWGFEIDEVYYKLAKERLDRERAQVRLDLGEAIL